MVQTRRQLAEISERQQADTNQRKQLLKQLSKRLSKRQYRRLKNMLTTNDLGRLQSETKLRVELNAEFTGYWSGSDDEDSDSDDEEKEPKGVLFKLQIKGQTEGQRTTFATLVFESDNMNENSHLVYRDALLETVASFCKNVERLSIQAPGEVDMELESKSQGWSTGMLERWANVEHVLWAFDAAGHWAYSLEELHIEQAKVDYGEDADPFEFENTPTILKTIRINNQFQTQSYLINGLLRSFPSVECVDIEFESDKYVQGEEDCRHWIMTDLEANCPNLRKLCIHGLFHGSWPVGDNTPEQDSVIRALRCMQSLEEFVFNPEWTTDEEGEGEFAKQVLKIVPGTNIQKLSLRADGLHKEIYVHQKKWLESTMDNDASFISGLAHFFVQSRGWETGMEIDEPWTQSTTTSLVYDILRVQPEWAVRCMNSVGARAPSRKRKRTVQGGIFIRTDKSKPLKRSKA